MAETQITQPTQADLRARKAAYHRAYMKKHPHKRDLYQERYYAKKFRASSAFKQEADQKDFLFLDIKKEAPQEDVVPPPYI